MRDAPSALCMNGIYSQRNMHKNTCEGDAVDRNTSSGVHSGNVFEFLCVIVGVFVQCVCKRAIVEVSIYACGGLSKPRVLKVFKVFYILG